MNLRLLSLSWRYVFSRHQEKSVFRMILVCIISVFIGSFALAFITAIMNGFQSSVHEKLQGIHAHIILEAPGENLDEHAISKDIQKHFPQITAVTARSTGYALIPAVRETDTPHVIMLESINPSTERLVTSLEKKLVTSFSLEHVVHDNHAIIGKALGQSLGISIGDFVDLYYYDSFNATSHRLTLQKATVICSDFFQTGIDEMDSSLVYCSQPFFNTLFPDIGTMTILACLHPSAHEEQTITALSEHFKLDVYSWKALYPALVSALKLEKYALFFILALVTLAACMNILSLIFMQITRKRPDIALLLALGACPQDISRVFLLFALMIGFIGCVLGVLLAWACSLILQRYPWIELPDAYYVTQLPAHMTFEIAAAVIISVIILCMIASYIPLRSIRKLSITQVLRSE